MKTRLTKPYFFPKRQFTTLFFFMAKPRFNYDSSRFLHLRLKKITPFPLLDASWLIFLNILKCQTRCEFLGSLDLEPRFKDRGFFVQFCCALVSQKDVTWMCRESVGSNHNEEKKLLEGDTTLGTNSSSFLLAAILFSLHRCQKGGTLKKCSLLQDCGYFRG